MFIRALLAVLPISALSRVRYPCQGDLSALLNEGDRMRSIALQFVRRTEVVEVVPLERLEERVKGRSGSESI